MKNTESSHHISNHGKTTNDHMSEEAEYVWPWPKELNKKETASKNITARSALFPPKNQNRKAPEKER